MHRIITIDPENSGIPEDGFGIDDSGRFFVAICKGGFEQEGKESLIFKFNDKGIIVVHDKVYVSASFKLNDFNIIKDIAEDNYDVNVLSTLYEYYKKFSQCSKKKKDNSGFQSITPILGNVLSKVYKAVGRYYSRNKVNLKRNKFTEFSKIVYKSELLLT
jgi:hypothetical protein